MLNSKIQIGVIGCGGISFAHEGGYDERQERVQVVACCDIDRDKAQWRAERYNSKIYTDYNELISDPDIDMVDIMLPHHLHFPAAMAAINARKHVLLEKPIGLNSGEAQQILAAARKSDKKFTVAENTRYVKAYQEAEKLLQSGALGDITLVRTFLPGSEKARLSETEFWGKHRNQGGGAIIDSAPHSFYLLKWLFGEYETVWASHSQILKLESEVEDNAVVMGRLKCGAEYHCGFSFSTEIPWNERLEIYGTVGSLIIDQLVNPVAVHFDGGNDFDGHPLPDVPYEPAAWKYYSIIDEVKDFIDAVYEDRPPLIDPQDAAYAIKIIDKAYESSRINQVVKVD